MGVILLKWNYFIVVFKLSFYELSTVDLLYKAFTPTIYSSNYCCCYFYQNQLYFYYYYFYLLELRNIYYNFICFSLLLNTTLFCFYLYLMLCFNLYLIFYFNYYLNLFCLHLYFYLCYLYFYYCFINCFFNHVYLQ